MRSTGPDTDTEATTLPPCDAGERTGALTEATPRSRSSTLSAHPLRRASGSSRSTLPAEPRSIGSTAPTGTIVRRLWGDSRDSTQTRSSPREA